MSILFISVLATYAIMEGEAYAQSDRYDLYDGDTLTLDSNNHKNGLIHLSGDYYVSSHTGLDTLPEMSGSVGYVNTINLYRITNNEITLIHTRIIPITDSLDPDAAKPTQQQHPYSTSITRMDDDTIAVAFADLRASATGSYISTYDITTQDDNPTISDPVRTFNYRSGANDNRYAFDQSLILLNADTLVITYAHGVPPKGFMNVINVDTTTGALSNVDYSPGDSTSEHLTLGINQHRYTSMVRLDDDTAVVAYRGPSADGIIRTYDIVNDVVTGRTPLVHDSGRISYNSLVRIDDDTVALAYSEIGASGLTNDGSGHLKTFDVGSDGTIIQRHDITYYAGAADAPLETDIHHSSIARVDDDTLALAYRGENGEGFVRMYDITSTGLEANGDPLRHDTYGFFNSLLLVDDDTLALVYGQDYPVTVSESADTATKIRTIIPIDSATDATPPEFVSARTTTDPRTIIITTTENLFPDGTISSQDFTVTVDGVNNPVTGIPNLDSNEITIQVMAPMGGDAEITVGYAGSAIVDRAGNHLGMFSESVTNNVIDSIPPVYVSVSVSGTDMIVIETSEMLAGMPSPAGFTVSDNTVTDVTISKNVITLLVSEPILPYTTIFISYTAGAITDRTSNALASFDVTVEATPVLLVGGTGTGRGEFKDSEGIAANSTHVLVADKDNDRIQILDMLGNQVSEFGSSGNGDGEFGTLHDVAVDSANIVTSDTVGGRVQIFNLDGTFVDRFSPGSGNSATENVALNSTRIFVTDRNGDTIRIFDRDTNLRHTLNSNTDGFSPAAEITTNSTHTITVSRNSQHVQVLDMSGAVVDTIGSGPGSDPGVFRQPVDVALNSKNIFVADRNNDRLQIFDLSGDFVHAIEMYEEIDFDKPTAIAANDKYLFSMHTDDHLRIVDLAPLWPATISSVSAPSGTYAAGETVPITVKFSRDIDVMGAPQLVLDVGMSATFMETVGPDAMFEYVVKPGDDAMNLNYINTNALTGGMIETTGLEYTVAADRTLPELSSEFSLAASNVMVDGSGPVPVISSVVEEDAITNMDPISYTVTFDEAPVQFNSDDLLLEGTTATVTSVSGSGTMYTVVIDVISDGTLTVSVPADVVQDASGNPNLASDSYSVTVDTTRPEFSLATITTSNTIAIEADEHLAGMARIEDFAVSGNTITGMDVFGMTITLTVTNPITYQNSPNISYTGSTVTDSTVTDIAGNTLVPFDSRLITPLPVRVVGEQGGMLGQFDTPGGVAITPTRIFVADTNNDRIQILDALGNPVDVIGSTGTGQNQFDKPVDVAANSTHILVTDADNNRIKILMHDGTFVGEFMSGTSTDPIGSIAISDTGIFVAEQDGDMVNILNLDGTSRGDLLFGPGTGRISATGIAVNSTHIIVSSLNDHQVQILDMSGTQTGIIGTGADGSAQDPFNEPRGVAVNSGNILVADSSNDRIQFFDQSGDYSHTINSYTNISFDQPMAMTADDMRAFVMHGDDTLRIIDHTLFEPPIITGVSVPFGTYTEGETVPITVTFDRSVTVTGLPQLALDIGSDTGTAVFSSGSPGEDIVFGYAVGVGQTFENLRFADTDALTLNGGTITSTDYTTPARLELPPSALRNNIGLSLSDSPTVSDSVRTTQLFSFTSANVMNARNIVITATEPLQGDPLPEHFVVDITDTENVQSVNPVNNVELSGKMMTLTMDEDILQDYTVTVSYTGTNLTDAAGNALVLTARQVTNDLVDATGVWNDLGNTELGLSIGDTLTITFPEDTDTPGGMEIQRKSMIDTIFTFQRSIGANYTGIWTDPRTFVISITNTTDATAEVGDSVSPFTGIRYLHNLDTAGGQPFTQPNGVDANSTGFVYVADGTNDLVQIFDIAGDFVGKLTSPDSGFTRPNGVAVNDTDFVFVTNGFPKNNVEIFDPSGNFVKVVLPPDGNLGNPTDIEVGKDGSIFVASASDSTIRKFDPSGNLVKELTNTPRPVLFPRGIAVNSIGAVYAAGALPDAAGEVVQIFNSGGVYVGDLDVTGTIPFDGLSGIAVNSTDFIFVSNTGPSVVQVFNPDGTFAEIFTPLGGTQFGTPANIATFGEDQFVISDRDTDGVQIYGRAIIQNAERTEILFDRPIFTTGDFGIFIEPLVEADSPGIADGVMQTIIITVSDSIVPSDMVTGMGFISPSDSPIPSESTTINQAITLSDSVVPSDGIAGMGMISQSDSLVPLDSTTVVQTIRLSDSITPSDGITGMGMISQSDSLVPLDSTTVVPSIKLSDSLVPSDGVTGMGMISQSDSLAPLDSVMLSFIIMSSDSITPSDGITGMGMITVSDSPEISDRHLIITMGSLAPSDSLTPSDSASFATTLSFDDSLVPSDRITGMGMVSVTDSLAPSDSASFATTLSFDDSLVPSDGVTGMGMISPSDSPIPSDSTTLELSIQISDSLSPSDEIMGDGTIVQSDSPTPSDSIAVNISITTTDSITPSDGITGMGMISQSDSLVPLDSTTVVPSIKLSDSLVPFDGITGMGMISQSDSLAPSDSGILGHSITSFDSLTPSDGVTGMGMISQSDSLVPLDSTTVVQTITLSDSITPSDGITGMGMINQSDSLVPLDSTTVVPSIKLSDSLVPSDGITGMGMISVTDSLTLSESASFATALIFDDSLVPSDGVTGMGMISPSDSLAPSDSVMLSFIIISSDSITPSDGITGMGFISPSDSPTPSDSASLNLSISVTDSLVPSDEITGDGTIKESDSLMPSDSVTVNLSISVSDSSTPSDVVTGMNRIMIRAFDSLTLSDSATAVPSIMLSDSLVPSDGVTGMGMISPSDSLAPSDSGILGHSITSSDSITPSDGVTGMGMISPSDSPTPSDSASLNLSISVTDSLVPSDGIMGDGTIIPSDSPEPSDSVTVHLSISASDSATPSDGITGMGMISPSDSPTLSDSATAVLSLRASDSLVPSDGITGMGMITQSDSPTLSDSITLEFSITSSDSITPSDRVTGMNMISPSDSPTPYDSTTLGLSLQISDSPSISDEILGDGTIVQSDSLTPSDSIAVNISLTIADSITPSDGITGMGMISVSDSITPSDRVTGMGSVVESDSLTPSHSTLLNLSITSTDSITPSDGITGMGMISVTDSITPSDGVTGMGSVDESDSLTPSHSTLLNLSITTADSITPTDMVEGMGVISVSDSITPTDDYSFQIMGSIDESDSPALSDSAAVLQTISVSDSLVPSESITGMGMIRESDSLTPSHSTLLNLSIQTSDSIIPYDRVTGMGSVDESDSLTPSDSATAIRSLHTSDSITPSDAITGMGMISVSDSLTPLDSAIAALPTPPSSVTPVEPTPQSRSGGGGGGGGGGSSSGPGGGPHNHRGLIGQMPYVVTFNFTVNDVDVLTDASEIIIKPGATLEITPHILPVDLRQNVLHMEINVTDSAALGPSTLVLYDLVSDTFVHPGCDGPEYKAGRIYACDGSMLVSETRISYSETEIGDETNIRDRFKSISIPFEEEFSGKLSILLKDTRLFTLAVHEKYTYYIIASDPDEKSEHVDPEPVIPMDPEPVIPMDPEPVLPMDPEPVLPMDPEPVIPMDPEPVLPMDPEPEMPADEPQTEPDVDIFTQIIRWFQSLFGVS